MEVGRAAVPYSNLRGAIGTFHAGKSADPSRKVSLPGHLLHREELRRCPSTQRTEKARHYLQKGDATKELSYQDTDAAYSTTCSTAPGGFTPLSEHPKDRTEPPFPLKVTLLRSFLTQIETLIPLLLRYQGTSRTTEVTPLFPPHFRGTPASLLTLRGPPIPSAR